MYARNPEKETPGLVAALARGDDDRHVSEPFPDLPRDRRSPPAMRRAILVVLACGWCAAVAEAGRPLPPEIESAPIAAKRLAQAGDWKAALEAGDRWLAESRRQFGLAHRETAEADLLLGEARQRLGEPVLAEANFRRALAAQEEVLPAGDPRIVITLTHLAAALRAQSRTADALPLLERALAIQRETRGPQDEGTAVSARNLALLLRHQRDYEGAARLLTEVLAIRRAAAGEDDPVTLAAWRELAEVHEARGDLAAAETCAAGRAAAIERVSPDSEALATALAEWGAIAARQGKLTEAEPRHRRALAIFEKTLEPCDPRLAASLAALGGCLRELGRLDEAAPLLERALAIRGHVFGDEAPETMESVSELGDVQRRRGDFAAARLLYARLERWHQQHPGGDPQARSEGIRLLAVVTFRAGLAAEAGPLFVASRQWHEQQFGPNHPSTLRTLGDLWTYYAETGDVPRALEAARELAARSADTLGSDAPGTLIVFERLAQLCAAAEEPAQALAWFQRMIEGTRRRHGPEARETLDALARIATACETMGDFASAGRRWRERLAAIEGASGPASAAATAARDELAASLERARRATDSGKTGTSRARPDLLRRTFPTLRPLE